MTEQIKALIVDDSSVVRRGVRTLLELDGGIRVVGEAGDGDEGLRLAAETKPDIVLLGSSSSNMLLTMLAVVQA